MALLRNTQRGAEEVRNLQDHGYLKSPNSCFDKLGFHFLGVLRLRALLFEVYPLESISGPLDLGNSQNYGSSVVPSTLLTPEARGLPLKTCA